MRKVLLFILLLLTVAVSGCVAEAPETSESNVVTETQESEGTRDVGDFKVVYGQTTNSDYAEYELLFKSSQTFELLAEELNTLFILPQDISIVLAECGEANAFYDPEQSQIQMCYELLDQLSETFNLEELSDDEYKKAIIDTWIFIFYHEVGHALVNVLDLPITGREEDSVDAFATFILTLDNYSDAALNGAVFFLLDAQNTDLEDLPFWEEHSLGDQRFYNIICWVYGNNPQEHSSLVEDGTLPESRAERCPAEYQQISTSWDRTTGPYVK
ncbi:DUF4344 domain-containing metallopeptidase [Candidatus Woesearchaeota archaeon]|nr:DUF4344 domain-containing metallopeptidase [Candidatus Woesearchaeota archaeon]